MFLDVNTLLQTMLDEDISFEKQITCMNPFSVLSPCMVRGGQLMRAITTNAKMKIPSAIQHQAAKGLAGSLNLFMM